MVGVEARGVLKRGRGLVASLALLPSLQEPERGSDSARALEGGGGRRH